MEFACWVFTDRMQAKSPIHCFVLDYNDVM